MSIFRHRHTWTLIIDDPEHHQPKYTAWCPDCDVRRVYTRAQSEMELRLSVAEMILREQEVSKR